ASLFGELLRPIIRTVDQHGLRSKHLRPHKSAVDRFFCSLAEARYASEVAQGYQARFAKTRAKLFTFLDHDGVPWNNNNAEHAIKAFVRLRNIIGGTSSVKGIREYLVLLSVAETCKCKGASVLDFFRSEQAD